ncbi:MAG: flagellin [Succinivibrionaceae bacterium]|nr:flagellin [Succinivibrionaceae bacterium]
MALFVNTNVSSINGQRNLAKATRQLDGSYQKLSSGLRINSAKDDAAGLQIADRMTAQINGLTQGNRNANDGISVCQTMEGALDEVTNMLQRIRTLAVQSSNGTNSQDERDAIQQEVLDLSAEIIRISEQTTYGKNLYLFNANPPAPGNNIGQTGTITFQVGAYSGNTVDLTFKSMTAILNNYISVSTAIVNGTVTVYAAGTKAMTALFVDSFTNAQNAINSVDNMLKSLDSYRADLGAMQNRLESSISNQENVIENVSDARSRIRDVDYASETAKMTQTNILQQAASTILSQANQKPQIALSLLGQ